MTLDQLLDIAFQGVGASVREAARNLVDRRCNRDHGPPSLLAAIRARVIDMRS